MIIHFLFTHTWTVYAKQHTIEEFKDGVRAHRHIWKSVTTDAALSIASTMVGAQLDYCNAILYGTTKSNVTILPRVQNSITTVLAQLHWLKIALQIKYKVALLTFKALTTHQPADRYDQLQLCTPTRQIR